ncbi:hypothetical protein EV644_14727 [Kribbella orskensis]|uniref:Uncharacterized protein n=1 Tax=Kribbella orskensis TaxID=2512216 RepID=A0ABY2B8B9_9ACTN|nr:MULTISPECIES: hypothetical protein [Kribbella]TCN28334.1 hypothetical protein EV642_15314 [Kribbella sp. VKM Ac-2500]TCO08197.1 hypothetical protein EV644_14727 [Kribbella orskensis]
MDSNHQAERAAGRALVVGGVLGPITCPEVVIDSAGDELARSRQLLEGGTTVADNENSMARASMGHDDRP